MLTVVDGDLLDQTADAIVNAWNRNIIPWWLLVPHGVSGAIKARGGYGIFRELARAGPMSLGSAVATSAGRLPHKAIIHVAGIDMLWRASEFSIRASVASAMRIAAEMELASIAFPVIGAGSGGFDGRRALDLMTDTLAGMAGRTSVTIVRWRMADI